MTSNHNRTDIFTADLLVADVICPIDKHPKLAKLVAEYQRKGKLKPDDKLAISKEEMERFAEAVDLAHMPPERIIPGGSSANVVATLRKLFPDRVGVTFMGVVGESKDKDDPNGKIKHSLQEAGINFLAQTNGHVPESALSFVIRFPNGKRAIATYPGNAKAILKSSFITDDMIQNSSEVLVQGSLWQKLDETPQNGSGEAPDHELGFADKLLKLRWKYHKDLWLAMPTQADFGTEVIPHAERARRIMDLIRSANVIFGNNDELARVYTTEDEQRKIKGIIADRNITEEELKDIPALVSSGKLTAEEVAEFNFANKSIVTDTAIKRLQKTLQERFLTKAHGEQRWQGNTSQVAFITCGKDPVYAVTADHIVQAPAAEVSDDKIVNTLGAGDTAYAGFLAAKIGGMGHCVVPNDYALEFASALAGVKVTQPEHSARVTDPRKSMEEAGWMVQGSFEKAPRIQGPGFLQRWLRENNQPRTGSRSARTQLPEAPKSLIEFTRNSIGRD